MLPRPLLVALVALLCMVLSASVALRAPQHMAPDTVPRLLSPLLTPELSALVRSWLQLPAPVAADGDIGEEADALAVAIVEQLSSPSTSAQLRRIALEALLRALHQPAAAAAAESMPVAFPPKTVRRRQLPSPVAPAGAATAPHFSPSDAAVAISRQMPGETASVDCAALSELFFSTGGAFWKNRVGWETPLLLQHCCDVPVLPFGVSCSGGFVAVLALSGNNLTGILPASLGSLHYLKVLNLSGNALSGAVPESLRFLPLLETVDLSFGNLSLLPPNFDGLVSLRTFDVSSNSLQQEIPASLWDVTSLENLDLSSNRLLGTLSPNVGQLQSLKLLNLAFNQIGGEIPSTIGNLTHLQTLYLYRNDFVGTIPDALCNCTSLLSLDLDTNRLAGEIPACLGNLSLLKALDFDTNLLSGSIPPSLGSLTQLQELILYSNQLTGTLPPELGALTEMVYFQVNFNMLHGPIPDTYGAMVGMQQFYVSANNLSGTLPASLGNWSQVWNFDVHGNGLSGAVPASYCSMVALKMMFLSDNSFESIPPCVFPTLFSLDLSFNRLTSFPYDAIAAIPTLASLDLSHNLLSGDFPRPLFVSASSLRSLSLANNLFSGPFPIAPCGTGAFPSPNCSALPQTNGLTFLDISYNQVTAFCWGDRCNFAQYCYNPCLSLTVLYMENVSLPSNLGDVFYNDDASFPPLPIGFFFAIILPTIEELYLGGNNIDSYLDPVFALPYLKVLDLRRNPLSFDQALSAAFHSRVTYDPTSSYAFSENMLCYQAQYSGVLDFLVDPSFFGFKNCQCRPGYYGKPPACVQCQGVLDNAHCSFASDAVALTFVQHPEDAWNASGNVIASSGYFASPAVSIEDMYLNMAYPTVIEMCPDAASGDSSCSATDLGPCIAGYRGRLCSACVDGYFRAGEQCFQCPTGVAFGMFTLLILLAILILLVISLIVGGRSSGVVKVLILFLQALFYSNVPLPGVMFFMNRIGVSASMLSFVGPECYVHGWTFIHSYVLSVLMPVFAIGMVGLAWCLGALLLLLRRASHQTLRAWLDRCLRSIVFFLLFTYLGVIRMILTPLACSPDAGNHDLYMISAPAERCSPTLRSVSSLLFIGYGIGLPIALGVLLIKTKALLEGHNRTRYVFVILFASYKPGFRYWELIATLRRVFYALSFAVFPSSDTWQCICAMAVLAVAFVLQAVSSPFRNRFSNILELVAIGSVQLNVVLSVKAGAMSASNLESAAIFLFAVNFVFVVVACGYIGRNVLQRIVYGSKSRRRQARAKEVSSDVPMKEPLLTGMQ